GRYNQVKVDRPDWHTLLQKDLKGVLSGKDGLYILRSNKVWTGGSVIITDEFAVTTFIGDHTGNFKFSVKVMTTPIEMDYCIKVIDTAKFFCVMVGTPTQRDLVKPPEMLCGCGALEVQDNNSTGLISPGNVLPSKCINGWTGVVTCHCPYTDIKMKFLENTTPQKYSKNCPGTYLSDQNFHHDCKYGSQESCIDPEPTKLPPETYEDIQECFWCSYYIKDANFTPHKGPLGWCRVGENEPYYLTNRKSCVQGGVQIGSGEVTCLIGTTKIKVGNFNETAISFMPCNPIKEASRGPPSRTTCTYKYAKTLKNKIYDEKDRYWGQYMVKGEYQYWFDLEQDDHVTGGLLKGTGGSGGSGLNDIFEAQKIEWHEGRTKHHHHHH
uniref:Genome polyprotein n=1 Tax=Norway rat pestivirus TaxID=1562066 RepID=UPI0030847012